MIFKSVVLPCAQQAAFDLFTSRISEWWPPERKHTKDPNSQLFLLPQGRFYERAPDGREVELGKVLAWEPPARLLLDFYPGTDAQHPTLAEITFAAEGAATRVTVKHGPKPESADLFDKRAPAYDTSWELCLASLAKAVGNK